MSEEQTGDNTPDETVAPSTTTEAEVKTEATEKPEEAKKPNKVQERINQLTREKYEARQKNTELEERLKALESKTVETKEPDLVAPNEDSFDDDSDYQKAQSDYIAEKAAASAYSRIKAENDSRDVVSKQQDREKQLSVKQKAFNQNLESKRSNFEDFEGVAYGHQFMDVELAEQLFDMDKGPEVAYHLGSHLDAAERIFSLPPVQRARELTRLEFGMDSVTGKKVSDAPDPITPLGSSESVKGDPDKMSADEWRTWRNKQVHGTG